MTYDRRTGKPIASTVTKIAPEVVKILYYMVFEHLKYVINIFLGIK